MRTTLIAAALAVAFVSLPARAGLFDDEEARKAILDLRAKMQQLETAQRQQSERVDTLVQERLGTMQRSMLDLNGQIEALRGEIAKLRGQNEQLARDLAETQRKVSDQTQAIDTRLKPLEPQKVTLDGREFQVAPDERGQYDSAMAMVRRGEFAEAAGALSGFLRRFPTSGYADSVRFWLGNALYGKRDYKEAIATFKAFIAANAEHPRAPEALLALANCQIELKDIKAAKRSLDDLIKAYPKTEAAQAGRERLAALR